ncbi:MAG: T9SS type A sorting domain-containing protein [Flavobacteriales bacterium]|nr:T9SS type A sorting domain-containing protein [Flavobacteriales bacterium]
MTRFLTKFQVAAALILIGFSAHAQFANVIIANGGQFEFASPYADRSTIGAYNPANGQYWVFDTIQVESIQDVVVDGNYAYLAASDSIIKYDLTTYEMVGQTYFAGIRSITIHDTMLFAGRYFGTGDYLEVFNKNTLLSIFSVPEIDNTVYSVQFVGDSAYIPYNQKGLVDQFPPYQVFNDTIGKIAVVDLVSQIFVRDILLDTIGSGVKAIYNYNDQLYTICDANGVVAHYDPINDTVIFDEAGVTRGIAQVDSLIYVDYATNLGAYDVKNMQTVNDSIFGAGLYSSGALDTLNAQFYINSTDFGSYGLSEVYSMIGAPVTSFDVNISPEAVAVDYKSGNYGPIAIDDVLDNCSGYINVLENDFDPNGDSLTISILTYPIQPATVLIEGDSIFFSTQTADLTYVDSFQYMVCDTSVCDSAWVFINCSGGNGIESISKNQINVYPNPTSVIVNITGVENGNYSVVDINGRLILSGSLNNSKSINLEDEPAGVYFIKITNALKSSTVKVIKL